MPHSEIHGSKGARPSPRLIAACHVLHRLSMPRHPSNALELLDRSSFLKAFMHGEDCAAIANDHDTHGLATRERARRCLSPSYASTGGACAHGRTLNSRCHRTAGALDARRRTCFLLTSPRIRHEELGGARRDRTDDLKLAKLPLSQLSYGPDRIPVLPVRAVVGPDRFELSTPRLSSVCSNQLSYGPSPAAVALRIEAQCAATGLVLSSTRRADRGDARVKEKRNEDGGEPLNALKVLRAIRSDCPSRSRGSAFADVLRDRSLERR